MCNSVCCCCCCRCFRGEVSKKIKCLRCILVTINIGQMFLSSLLMAIFCFSKGLLADVEPPVEAADGMKALNGVLLLGIIIAILTIVTAFLGTFGVCCTSTLAIEAHVVFLVVGIVLEATATVEVLHLRQTNQSLFPLLISLSACPICVVFLSGPEGAFQSTAWILLIILGLQVLAGIVAVNLTLSVKRYNRKVRSRRHDSNVIDDVEIPMQETSNDTENLEIDSEVSKTKTYKRFRNESLCSAWDSEIKRGRSPLRNASKSGKMVTFSNVIDRPPHSVPSEEQLFAPTSSDSPLDLTTTRRK